MVYDPPVIADTIKFPLKVNESPTPTPNTMIKKRIYRSETRMLKHMDLD